MKTIILVDFIPTNTKVKDFYQIENHKNVYDYIIQQMKQKSEIDLVALQYDIVDVLKTILMERLILQFIRSREVTAADFEENNYLTKSSCKKCIQAYQIFMMRKYSYNIGKFTGYQLVDYHVKSVKTYLKTGKKIIGAKMI